MGVNFRDEFEQECRINPPHPSLMFKSRLGHGQLGKAETTGVRAVSRVALTPVVCD